MKQNERRLRLLLWAGIVCGLLGILLWAGSQYMKPSAQALSDAHARDLQFVQNKAVQYVHRLYAKAASVASDRELYRLATSHDPQEVALAFLRLESIPVEEGLTIELTDARGDVLAWSGRHWRPGIKADNASALHDSAVAITPAGSFLILTVSATRDSGRSHVVLSTPVQIDEVAVARLFPVPYLTSVLIELTSGHSRIMASPSVTPTRIGTPLLGLKGEKIGFVLGAQDPRELLNASEAVPFSATLLLISALIAAWLALVSIATQWRAGIRVGILVVATWITRYALLMLEIPSRFPLGTAIDPAVYGTTFGGGLSGTPFDLLLSAASLVFTLMWLSELAGESRNGGQTLTVGRPIAFVQGGLTILAGSGFLMLMSRGYSASIKSIVEDSTVQIYDALDIIPDPASAILLSAAFLLTIALMIAWTAMLRYMFAAATNMGLTSRLARWLCVGISLVLVNVAFLFVDRSGVLPTSLPLFALLVCVPLAAPELLLWRRTSSLWIVRGLAVVLIALPVIDTMVRQRSRDEIRHAAEDRLRPEDSWLSFLLSNDLRDLARKSAHERSLSLDAGSIKGSQAFRLWTLSTISRQPVNSGVVIFDEGGREVDRFVVGFSSFEQQMALQALFEGDEETVQSIDHRMIGGRSPFYGIWGTVRDSANIVLGSIALILTPTGEDPLLLSAADQSIQDSEENPEIEYVANIAVRSTDPHYRTGSVIDPEVVQALTQEEKNWIWVEDPDGNTETLYVRDPSNQERTLAVVYSAEDIRWRAFHAAKIIAVFAFCALIGAFVRSTVHMLSGGGMTLSFRARLFMAFGSIAIVPLILLAVYNQRLSEERTTRSLESELRRDLSQVIQRVNAFVESEEDIERGVTDDFCSSVAAELDIEFTVYRGMRLQASSRPELYTSSLLDDRMPGSAFAAIRMLGEDFIVTSQRIGSVTYAVGFGPWIVDGRPAGILAVPTLYRQQEIEQELAERNAYILVAYAIALMLMLFVGGLLSERIARPLRELTLVTRELGKGRVRPLKRSGRDDEIGELINAFDDMVQQLEAGREKLARAEREHAWKEMAKQVAHEIKNPLTPMKLSVQHLRQAFKDKARDREKILALVSRTLLEQIDTLSRIATEFSQFARLPHRTFERVDVGRMIREAADLFATIPGITIGVHMPKEPVTIVADSDEIRRAFVNLFRNSIQAMNERGTIRVTGAVDQGILTVVFVDSGPGVPEHLRSKIFEPSFSTKTEGMGLGLAIVRRVIEDMGGTINLRPSVKGATFEIRLPI